MTEIKYIIHGEPRTKKNHTMIVGFGRRCPVCHKFENQRVRQGSAYGEYAEKAVWQLHPRPEKPIDYPVNVRCMFYMATKRIVDGLNLQAAVDDILVDAGILEDDNSRIVVGHDGSRVLYDKEDPRTEIYITKEV